MQGLGARVGPWRVVGIAGRGGMSRVLRATHDAVGITVALKVLTRSATEAHRRALLHEIRAAASLDHPSVLRVLDAGTLPADAAVALGVDPDAGLPWMATEWASGGCLGERELPAWDAGARALRALLAALAHAHARGLVHCDVKAQNLLLATNEDLRPGWKLADFGIARTADAQGGALATPATMAPEQGPGAQWPLGPWTDLYAVGCLGWQLATGRPPYTGAPAEVLRAKRTSAPPRLEPLQAVPDALEGWLRALLARLPAERPGSAAEALAGLEALGPAREAAVHGLSGLPVSFTLALDDSTTMDLADEGGLDPVEEGPSVPRARDERGTAELPPLDEPETTPRWTPGTGVGLVDLVDPPWVGRDAERQALWEVARRVWTERRPGGALILGGPRSGRTRLARWLVERVVEQGIGVGIVAGHQVGTAPSEGLVGAARAWAGLPAPTSGPPIRPGGGWPENHAEELTALLDLMPSARPAEVAATVLRALARGVSGEPLVVIAFDDLDRSPSDWEVARALLEGGRAAGRVVVVAISADEHLTDEASRGVGRWEARADVAKIPMAPLPTAESLALARALAGTGEVGLQLAEGSGGRPGRMVDLLRRWSANGLVSVGPLGYVAALGRALPSAEEPQEADARRLRAALERLPPTAARVAEVLALASAPPTLDELAAAISARDGEPAEAWIHDALEALERARLAVDDPRTGRVVLARDTVHALRSAAERGGEAPATHRAWASLLSGQGTAERCRRAEHLLAAGDVDEAWLHLKELDAAGARDWVELAQRVASASAPASRTERELAVRAMQASWSLDFVRLDGLEAQLRAICAEAEAAELTGILATAQGTLGFALHLLGRLPEALECLALAADLYLALGRLHNECHARSRRAQVLLELGRLDEAEGELTACIGRSVGIEPPDRAAWTLAAASRALSIVARAQGDLARSEALLERARGIFAEQHNAYMVAECANNLGDLLRARGDLPGAVVAYEQARRGFTHLWAGSAAVVTLNLALVELQLGHDESALAAASSCKLDFTGQSRRALLGAASLAASVALAGLGEADRAGEELVAALGTLEAVGFVDPDLVVLAALGRARATGALAERFAAFEEAQRAALARAPAH